MAHFAQLEFSRLVRDTFPARFHRARVVEIGSWDVNGGVRQFFDNCDYIGVDIAPDDGVDLGNTGENLSFPESHFDIAISCECFEHNPFWLETFINMWRMLKPGGLLVFTCALTGRREHGTRRAHSGKSLTADHGEPDYYQNLCAADFRSRLNLERLFAACSFAQNPFSRDLYFVGIRRCASLSFASLQEQLTAVARRGERLVRPGRTSDARLLGAVFRWRLHHAISRTLGESSYHDLFYHLGRIFRRG